MSKDIEVDEDGFAGSLVYKKIEALFSWFGDGGQISYFDGNKYLGTDNVRKNPDDWEQTARNTIDDWSPINS